MNIYLLLKYGKISLYHVMGIILSKDLKNACLKPVILCQKGNLHSSHVLENGS